MNQYRFDINDQNPEYTGPPCPRVVKCEKCKRIMEAPLLGTAEECCLSALGDALETWLKDEYAKYMKPTQLEIAMAGVSLDALIYDMKHGFTIDYLVEHPGDVTTRDEFMNKRLVVRLKEQGFSAKLDKDGVIDAEAFFDDFNEDQDDYGQFDWTN